MSGLADSNPSKRSNDVVARNETRDRSRRTPAGGSPLGGQGSLPDSNPSKRPNAERRCEHGYGPEGCTYPMCWNAAPEYPLPDSNPSFRRNENARIDCTVTAAFHHGRWWPRVDAWEGIGRPSRRRRKALRSAAQHMVRLADELNTSLRLTVDFWEAE